ncbi:hypothetical protein GQ53DRAFT_746373 [Thozetella sp. PMI_491]|nr:hypothetical protein GQ53DRAFT_746373 [Thozetella sp. PMI_491]
MDGLLDLNLVSSSYRPSEAPVLEEVKSVQAAAAPKPTLTPSSPEAILDILRQEPDYESLVSVLHVLGSGAADSSPLNITRPGSQSAQIIQVLITEIVPNYWTLLKEDSPVPELCKPKRPSELELLLRCLRSITGINAMLVRLRALVQEVRSEGNENRSRSAASLNITVALDLLGSVLQPEDAVHEIWTAAAATAGDSDVQRRALSHEILAVLGGGRLFSLAAEAEHIIQQRGEKDAQKFWVADPQAYAEWLGGTIAMAMAEEPSDKETKFLSDLFLRALRLGQPDLLVKIITQKLLFQQQSKPATFSIFLDSMLPMEQRKVMFATLKLFSLSYLDRYGSCESDRSAPAAISSVAGAINAILGASTTRREHVVTWLTSSSGAGLGEGVGIRRAVLSVFAQDRAALSQVLDKSLNQFGDQLYIKHSPVLQQEAHAQVLLLSAGYAYRLSPSILTALMRSSAWLNTISNRLATTHQRARLLGMVVGEAFSALVDRGDKKLDFHTGETNSGEAQWYKSLTQVSDNIGCFVSLGESGPRKAPTPVVPASLALNIFNTTPKPERIPAGGPTKLGFIIEEVEGDDDDDDLVPYAKPDSDAEDSDEDPTLIQRNKPKAPVYIRDLIRYLRDTESYDHQKLALTTAPILIRRKANHGAEVSEHADELASLLIGLQDKFDIEDFYDLRVQALISIVVAQPQTMCLWFAKTFFDGDYSISQRAAILVVLGLSAREIAGLETSGYAEAASFPSKALPTQVERLYLGDVTSREQSSRSNLKPLPLNALDSIANSLTSSFMAPLLASAVDKVTGSDALKLSTFTSRLDASNVKYKSRTKPRTRIIPNTTAQLISSSFFTPLTARFQAALHSKVSRTRGILFQPTLLALYIKTLGILLHSAGPSTLALPDMTAELWAVLLSSSVRMHCVGDLGVTRAVLFALLVLLEVNQDRMRDICQDMGKEVVETQEWVASVFEGIRGGDGDGGEESEAKGMAAAALVRLKEGVDKYQLLLAGDLIG